MWGLKGLGFRVWGLGQRLAVGAAPWGSEGGEGATGEGAGGPHLEGGFDPKTGLGFIGYRV